MAGKGSGGLAAVRRLTHHPLVAFVAGAITLSQALACNVGGVEEPAPEDPPTHPQPQERRIRRLKVSDPAAAEAELAPSAGQMARAEVGVAA